MQSKKMIMQLEVISLIQRTSIKNIGSIYNLRNVRRQLTSPQIASPSANFNPLYLLKAESLL